jgi:tripartite-type tricarboxylate transporter receptor subunit TctC
MKIKLLIALFMTALWSVGPALAQTYPTKPIKLVVPYPPGGVIDLMARYLAVPLSQDLKQSVVVENISGAGGLIGHGAVARAAPDGYTLVLAAAGPVAASVKLYKNIPYDPTRDFTAIGMVSDVDVVLVASKSLPVNSFQEFIRYGRENAGKLSFAINSPGSMHHLLTEQLLALTKIDAIRVPYKGAGQAVMDLLAGRTDVEIESLPVVIEYVKAGRLKVLAVASERRLKNLPDSPTFGELGYKALLSRPWYALLGPAGMPPAVVAKLNAQLNRTLLDPKTQDAFDKLGVRAITSTPAETDAFMRAETEKWNAIIAQTGLHID